MTDDIIERQFTDFSLKLRLFVGQDDDIIAFLRSAPPRRRAQFVMAAMRSGQMFLIAAENETADFFDFSGMVDTEENAPLAVS
jgi:hypothetical protein